MWQSAWFDKSLLLEKLEKADKLIAHYGLHNMVTTDTDIDEDKRSICIIQRTRMDDIQKSIAALIASEI